MIDLVERIGPIVGIVAFLGFAVLAFLIFQQAREVRRLRDWAGRAPERAAEATAAAQAAAEARGEAVAEGDQRGRLAAARARIATVAGAAWSRLDRSSPVDPRYLAAVLVALIAAAGILIGGFGLLDEDEDGRGREGRAGGEQQRAQPQEVAILNGTQVVGPDGLVIQGIPGLADEVAEDVVADLRGFTPGRRDNAGSSYEQTTVMFEPGSEDAASRLARAIRPSLGEAAVEEISDEARELADGASVVLVLGLDDADF